jgi:hypothetical protein
MFSIVFTKNWNCSFKWTKEYKKISIGFINVLIFKYDIIKPQVIKLNKKTDGLLGGYLTIKDVKQVSLKKRLCPISEKLVIEFENEVLILKEEKDHNTGTYTLIVKVD